MAEILIVGKATFEIVLHRTSAGEYVGFDFFFIEAGSIAQVEGSTVQRIPKALADRRGLPMTIKLPENGLIVFDEPHQYKGHLNSLMDVLALVSGPPSPPFAMPSLETGKMTVPYDFSAHNGTRLRLIGEATRKIGWDARGMLRDSMGEAYEVARHIRFQLFLIHVREHLLKKINRAIRVAGEQIGFSTELKFNGLPTEHDVLVAQKHLANGTASFGDILKPFASS